MAFLLALTVAPGNARQRDPATQTEIVPQITEENGMRRWVRHCIPLLKLSQFLVNDSLFRIEHMVLHGEFAPLCRKCTGESLSDHGVYLGVRVRASHLGLGLLARAALPAEGVVLRADARTDAQRAAKHTSRAQQAGELLAFQRPLRRPEMA